jgi:IS30 family transposase
LISDRPAEVEDRAVPGHWEGDLIIGWQRSAIGTLVERSTRFTMLIHLPREDGCGVIPRTKNGPPLAGYGAVTMKNALASAITTLPEQLRRSLTWDRGKELSQHAQFKVETGVPVFFADPHSPWQRGTNENTNGLLRQYFPKGTDLSRWDAEEITAVANALNNRPRKTLGWKTPAQPGDVLTTGGGTSVDVELPPPTDRGSRAAVEFLLATMRRCLVPGTMIECRCGACSSMTTMPSWRRRPVFCSEKA